MSLTQYVIISIEYYVMIQSNHISDFILKYYFVTNIQYNLQQEHQHQRTMIIIQTLERLVPKKKINIDNNGYLMRSSIPYYLLAAITFAGIFKMGSNPYVFIVIIYAILPLLDEILSLDWRNPTEEQRKQLQKNDFWFKLPLYLVIVLDWILFFKIMNTYSTYEFSLSTILNLMGMVFIISNLNAVQFAVAHQIFHKNGTFNKLLGTLTMSKLLYMHFTYQHLWGHHRRVATPEDPATAQKGITVYKFFPKTFLGSYKSVYQMEKQAGKPFYLNYSVLSIVQGILFPLLMLKVYGFQGFVLFLITAFGAIFYLEAINYIEHYGLQREKKSDGTYEKVTIKHSWNAPHRISNYLLYKLQRHSDHHENSLKPYQTLVSLQDSPHLPHGYSLIIFLSFFPSLWFKIMDPMVDAYNKVKSGCIDQSVKEKAITETRKFMLQLGLASIFLLIVNYGFKMLGSD